MFPTHIIKNCLDFFKQDKDHSYLSFVYDIYMKSTLQTDTVLQEILSHYLIESFSKKSVPFNVLANSQHLIEFFQTLQTYSLTPSKEVISQKNKLKEQVQELGFFNQETIMQLDSLFSQVMIDSFFEFSKLKTKIFNINSKDLTITSKVHSEFLTFFNDQEIISTFVEKENGFYLVKKSIPDPFIVTSFCHSIVMKSNSQIHIFDIDYEKKHSGGYCGKKNYRFFDFINQNFDYIKKSDTSSQEISTTNLKNTIFTVNDYNLLVLLNLIFIIQNQHDVLIDNGTIINNYIAPKNNHLPMIVNSFVIPDISLADVKYDDSLHYLNSIEAFFKTQLETNINFINFKPDDYTYSSVYSIKPFHSLSERKMDYTHFNVRKNDYEYAASYGIKPDFLPLQELGSLSIEDYNKYLKLFGQFNKTTLLKEYNNFHVHNHLSTFKTYIQNLMIEHWDFFKEQLHLLEQHKVINTTMNEYNNFMGSKILLSDNINFEKDKKIKAVNKNVYANQFQIYAVTQAFFELIEKNFEIPNEFKLFFITFYNNQYINDLNIPFEMKENFDIHSMSILSLCDFRTFEFFIFVPWKS